ncbi:LarC family nickel insertion protein, partial [Anaerostipes caccae]|uniref:nickel insertion protein n=1 Tax=Anaerostipes caccae TaxID=105841 RepID=UPI00210D9023
ILDHEHENHDHDMEYLHGHSHDHSHGDQGHHSHDHEHRGLAEILEILCRAQITDGAREKAVRIFEILAEAEAKAHGTRIEKVHFHEVGAVDSIVDITAAAVCLDNLQIDKVIIPVLCEGSGSVRCQHGVIPVP